MNYSKNHKMEGFWSGFPAKKVTWKAGEGQPAATGFSVKMSEDIYTSYRKAILENGYAPYLWKDEQGNIHHEVKYFVMQDTGFNEFEVTAVLKAIHDLAKDGDIENKFWNVEKQKELPAIPGLASMQELFSQYGKTVKYVSIAVIILFGLYMGWPIIKKIRKKMEG